MRLVTQRGSRGELEVMVGWGQGPSQYHFSDFCNHTHVLPTQYISSQQQCDGAVKEKGHLKVGSSQEWVGYTYDPSAWEVELGGPAA